MKKRLILMLAFLSIILNGCWDSREIQNFANVSGIAIDKGENGKKFKLTIEVINLSPANNQEAEQLLFESSGDTIYEALVNTTAVSFNRLYVGNCRVAIISEELAIEGLNHVFDILIRDHEFRITMGIIIARGNPAKDLLKDTGVYSKISSHEMKKMLENDEKYSSLSKKRELFKAASDLLNDGISMTLPVMELHPFDSKETFKLSGIAFFKDDKLAGYIEDSEIVYYLILTNEYSSSIFSLNLEGNSTAALETHSSKSKYKFVKNGENILLNIDVKITFSINGVSSDYQEYYSEEELATKLEEEIKIKSIQLFTSIVTNYGVDVFGFQKKHKENNYSEWKKMNVTEEDFLDKLILDINVKATVRTTGITQIDEEEKA